MNKRHIVITLATGAALSLGACGVASPPPEVTHNPPMPQPEPTPEPDGLPTWNEVKSGHPQGATNPPSPELIVTPDGDCYKNWRGARRPPSGDPVRVCNDDCGTQIECTPEAAKLLEAYNAKHK